MPNRKPKRKPCKCKTKYCRNKAKRGGLCYPCERKRTKEKNPMRYAYGVLRRNARRRKIPFTISFKYFKRFCIKYDYIARKGKTAESLTVDRKKNNLGYIPGNLRPLTLSQNSRKGTKQLDYDYITGTARVYTLRAEQMDYDTPF